MNAAAAFVIGSMFLHAAAKVTNPYPNHEHSPQLTSFTIRTEDATAIRLKFSAFGEDFDEV